MSQTGMRMGENGILVTGREWELNLRHHGNGIGNGNELTGIGENENVASHFRTSVVQTEDLPIVGRPKNCSSR